MAVNVGTDSYVTLAEAEDYFDGKLHTSEWDNAGKTTKEKALKEACRRINRLAFKGEKADETQLLAFPRKMPLFNRIGVIGFTTDTGIPEEVKQAQCEEALALLERGNSQRRKLQQEGVQSFTLGNMSETYAPGAGKGLLSQEARELLRPWLLGGVFIT